MKVKTIKNVYAIKARALHSATLHVEIVQILPTHAVDVYEIIKCIGLHFLHSFFFTPCNQFGFVNIASSVYV